MKRYDLTLDIKNPDVPFKIERSIGVQGGSLIEVFSKFHIELIRLLEELKQEAIDDDDIPF